jgi:Bacterial regulatory proteins, tetR family
MFRAQQLHRHRPAQDRIGGPPHLASRADGDPVLGRYLPASPPRQRNPSGTGDRLHGELVEAAVRVPAAHGDTERLSIRAVAAEAQVTPPAVYRCFPRPAGARAHRRGGLLQPL